MSSESCSRSTWTTPGSGDRSPTAFAASPANGRAREGELRQLVTGLEDFEQFRRNWAPWRDSRSMSVDDVVPNVVT